MAKAIGVGAQKAALTLKRHATGDFSPEGWIERPRQPFDPAPTPSPSKPVSLQTLLDGWAAEKQPTQKTIYSWKRVLEQLGTFVGHNDAARLTPDNLLQWKAGLLQAGLRTKTIRDSKIAPLRAILQWGVDNRKIAINPAPKSSSRFAGKWLSESGASQMRKLLDFAGGGEAPRPGSEVGTAALRIFRRAYL